MGDEKNNRVKVKDLLKDFKGNLDYDQDQIFLRHTLGPYYQDTTLIHCSTRLENFPLENDTSKYNIVPLNENHKHFVGEVFCGSNYDRPYNHIFY